ncbi:hypothetical protein V8J88_17025 [Massilia sp. W12]|uniref:hypothetical protein n=1 Tax=Massilia sp. W12 TaxID=3126507 RepID=UPI0030CFC51E
MHSNQVENHSVRAFTVRHNFTLTIFVRPQSHQSNALVSAIPKPRAAGNAFFLQDPDECGKADFLRQERQASFFSRRRIGA